MPSELGFWQTLLGQAPAYKPGPGDVGYNPDYNAIPGIIEGIGQVPAAINVLGGGAEPSLLPKPLAIAQAAQARPPAQPQPFVGPPSPSAGLLPPSVPPGGIAAAVQRSAGPPASLAAGAFRGSPEWGGVGGGPRTAGQIQQDILARGLLDLENDQRTLAIEKAAALRGDPMAKQIAAEKQELEFEDLMPLRDAVPDFTGTGARGNPFVNRSTPSLRPGVIDQRRLAAETGALRERGQFGIEQAVEQKKLLAEAVASREQQEHAEIDAGVQQDIAQLRRSPAYLQAAPELRMALEAKVREGANQQKREASVALYARYGIQRSPTLIAQDPNALITGRQQ
jgi:hypothetical protein